MNKIKEFFEDLFTNKISFSDIVNDLTTGGATVPGSAENDKTLAGQTTTDYDVWILNTDFTGGANPITTNLSQAATTIVGLTLLGDSMTQSSGIFTFPKTGIWEIEFFLRGENGGSGNTNSYQAIINTTNDNSTYAFASIMSASIIENSTNNVRAGAVAKFVFNVGDIANDKCSFTVSISGDSPTNLASSTTLLQTYMTFKRIGNAI